MIAEEVESFESFVEGLEPKELEIADLASEVQSSMQSLRESQQALEAFDVGYQQLVDMVGPNGEDSSSLGGRDAPLGASNFQKLFLTLYEDPELESVRPQLTELRSNVIRRLQTELETTLSYLKADEKMPGSQETWGDLLKQKSGQLDRALQEPSLDFPSVHDVMTNGDPTALVPGRTLNLEERVSLRDTACGAYSRYLTRGESFAMQIVEACLFAGGRRVRRRARAPTDACRMERLEAAYGPGVPLYGTCQLDNEGASSGNGHGGNVASSSFGARMLRDYVNQGLQTAIGGVGAFRHMVSDFFERQLGRSEIADANFGLGTEVGADGEIFQVGSTPLDAPMSRDLDPFSEVETSCATEGAVQSGLFCTADLGFNGEATTPGLSHFEDEALRGGKVPSKEFTDTIEDLSVDSATRGSDYFDEASEGPPTEGLQRESATEEMYRKLQEAIRDADAGKKEAIPENVKTSWKTKLGNLAWYGALSFPAWEVFSAVAQQDSNCQLLTMDKDHSRIVSQANVCHDQLYPNPLLDFRPNQHIKLHCNCAGVDTGSTPPDDPARIMVEKGKCVDLHDYTQYPCALKGEAGYVFQYKGQTPVGSMMQAFNALTQDTASCGQCLFKIAHMIAAGGLATVVGVLALLCFLWVLRWFYDNFLAGLGPKNSAPVIQLKSA
jgi:hypothetical protein